MTSRTIPWLILAAGMMTAATVRADDPPISIRYELNASQVSVGDSFQLDVVLAVRTQAPVEELTLPELPRAFTVLQERRGSSTQISQVNGKRQILTEQRYLYLLRADEPGSFRIAEATARIGGFVARTAPVVVRVVDQDASAARNDGVSPAAASSPGARFGKDPPAAFVEISVDRTSAWVGQQITATTEVYSQQPLAQWPRLPALKPAGFFCTSLLDENRPNVTTRMIGRRTYYVYLLAKDALFPLAAGDKGLQPVSVELVPAGSLFSRSREVTVRSATVPLQIKALPTENEPPGFSTGNVGHWQLEASVRPTRGALGQPLTLTLVATGTGSLEQLVLPSWNGGDQARVFPATTRREPRAVSATETELGGRVVVELLVQPQTEGQLRIPALTLATFDPDAGTYRQSVTAPIVVPIGGSRAGASSATAPQTGSRQLIARGARPLKRNVEAESPVTETPVVVGATSLAAGLVVWGAGLVRRKRRLSAAGLQASIRRDRQKLLDDARARGDLAALERVVLDALAERCGPAVKSTSTGELAALLEAQGIAAEEANDVVAFIRDVEAARYARMGGSGSRDGLAQAAGSLLARLEVRR